MIGNFTKLLHRKNETKKDTRFWFLCPLGGWEKFLFLYKQDQETKQKRQTGSVLATSHIIYFDLISGKK
jgi:hypothetical protein